MLALLVPERRSRTRSSRSTSRRRTTCARRRSACAHVRRPRGIGLGDEARRRFALEFEEPALATLGFAYEERGRLSGGAYHPILRKVDTLARRPLADAMAERERARRALLASTRPSARSSTLKARGFNSPYLRNFVVARINPLRFIKGEPPPIDELLPSMTKRARGMDVDKIKNEDVARTGGPPEGAE